MGELGQISSAHTTPKMWRWHFRVAGASLEARLAGSCAVPVGRARSPWGVSGDTGDDDSDKATTSAALSLAGIEASPALQKNSNLVLLVIGTAAPLAPELARPVPDQLLSSSYMTPGTTSSCGR